ncbi:acyltransferase family protein [Nocardiopsis sp. NPDC055551]
MTRNPTTARSPAPPTRRTHVPALDGLRGVAVIGVLLFHTGHLSGGFLGVDLFFVLSGYLITDLLLREIRASANVSLGAFLGRRIRRLLPALVVMLTTVTLLVWSFGPPDMVRTTLADGPWVQLNVLNWHLIAESAGYWDAFGSARVFEHLWSIAVEEQFYLVWPVLLLVAARLLSAPDRWVAGVAAAGSALSLVLMICLVDPADPTRVYIGTDTRAFSVLLGALVATPPVRDALARGVDRWAGAALVVAALGLGVSWVLVDGTTSPWLFTGGLFAHSMVAAMLIAVIAHAPRTTVARILAWGPLRWTGLISYSLYLWHWPVIVLLSPEVTGLHGWTWTLVVSAVSIGAAVLSKYLVEDPVRFHAKWARGRGGLVAFAAVMVALALLWVLLPAPPPATVDVTKLD